MFDLDGTLVDTMFLFADLAAEVMARRHGDDPKVARARYLETSGIPFIKQLAVIHPDHAENQAASDEFEVSKKEITARTSLDQRTHQALNDLRERGLRLIVSSNTGQNFVDEFVRGSGQTFDLALGFDETAGIAKGEPHVAATCQTLGLSRDEIWFVGDSIKDGELAHECNLSFVGRVGTFTRAEFTLRFPGVRVVEHPAELLEMIESCKS